VPGHGALVCEIQGPAPSVGLSEGPRSSESPCPQLCLSLHAMRGRVFVRLTSSVLYCQLIGSTFMESEQNGWLMGFGVTLSRVESKLNHICCMTLGKLFNFCMAD
jgi:hypothetical protein